MINISVKELDKYNFENCEINMEFLEKLIKELDNKNQEIERLTFIINHAKMYVERHEQLYDFDLMASPQVLLAILDGGLEEE